MGLSKGKIRSSVLDVLGLRCLFDNKCLSDVEILN